MVPTTIPDCPLRDAVEEAFGALQEWVACVGVVLVVELEVEVEAALEEEACLLRPTHTGHVQPRDLGRRLRLVGEGSTVRGHIHTRGAGPGHPHHPRVEEAEDDTRRTMTMTAVAARVATAMGVATVAAEAAREIAGVTAEQPSMVQVAGTSAPRLRLGQSQAP